MDTVMAFIGGIVVISIFGALFSTLIKEIFSSIGDFIFNPSDIRIQKKLLDKRDKIVNLKQRELDIEIKEKSLLARETAQKNQ